MTKGTIITTAIIAITTAGVIGATLHDAKKTHEKDWAFINHYGLHAFLTNGDGVSPDTQYTLVTQDGYYAGTTEPGDTLYHTMNRAGLVRRGAHYLKDTGILGAKRDAWKAFDDEFINELRYAHHN